MSCDIIIPVYNQLNYTKACLDSIKEHTDCQHRIIVVDDASDQDTAGYLDRLSSSGEIVLLRNENNLGWLKSVNKGIEYSKAEYVCVMNNDTLVYPGWLSEMVKIAEKNAQIGIVNPLWELPKTFFGTRNAYFRAIVSKQKSKFVETDWARGFCFLTKRAVIEKIGGLNEVFSPRYFEDWDYSIRAINAGFICVRALGAFVWHHKNITYENVFGKSGMNKEFEEKRKIFCARWGEPLRILLISDSSLENYLSFLESLSLLVLRDQNKLVIINAVSKLNIKHTNCILKRVAGFFLKIKLLSNIRDNLRHNESKRYNLIICSKKIKIFLDKIPAIIRNFKIEEIGADYKNMGYLMDEIRKMKKSNLTGVDGR